MKEDFGTQLENGSLRFERILPGPVDRVWEYLVDPEKRALWFAGGTMGEKPGDEFRWDFDIDKVSHESLPEEWSHMAEGVQAHARIVAIEPPHLLVVVGIEDTQEIRFELSSTGTRVRLVLIQQPPADYAGLISTAAGWQACLGVLLDRLSGREPRGFWSERAMAEDHYRTVLSSAS